MSPQIIDFSGIPLPSIVQQYHHENSEHKNGGCSLFRKRYYKISTYKKENYVNYILLHYNKFSCYKFHTISGGRTLVLFSHSTFRTFHHHVGPLRKLMFVSCFFVSAAIMYVSFNNIWRPSIFLESVFASFRFQFLNLCLVIKVYNEKLKGCVRKCKKKQPICFGQCGTHSPELRCVLALFSTVWNA